ncbi:hypothetical protein [Xanthobacter versatilis]|uniref:hypothetical protein n=1 Tax=Xanthobacter autotrophicus (strain ATCC BAA-1158 / Py2) TaxID=78245 RepID=UPI00372A7DCA
MALEGADAGGRGRSLVASALVVALAAVSVPVARAEGAPVDVAVSDAPPPAAMPAAEAPPNPPAPAVSAPASTAPAPTPGPAADPYAGLPKVVARAVQELEAECRAAEGRPNWKPGTLAEVVNVSPDGRPDYLIDTHAIACDGGFTPWIGSDGFRHILFVSTGPGRWVRAFDRGARGFEIENKGRKVPQVIVFSHSAYCTRPNPERYMRCTQVYEWRRGKLRKISEDWFTD